jgi:eukaryotic-like serine/threonine-protein kinase
MQTQDRTAVEGSAPLQRLGRYELLARIGEGGMAEVYLARMLGPMNFQKIVVVKKIHHELVAQGEFLSMLLDEARLSALIKHPRVVDIYELGRAGDTYFIAMEHLEGQPLSMVMSAALKGHPLDPCSIARIISDAAEGLHAAHELQTMAGEAVELVHRDVSPGNIIVLYDGTAKIVDFGVAKARGRLTQSGVRELKGKLGYMSPEQLTVNPIDRRSDVFSLGVVMWEALALKRLFPGESSEALEERMRTEVPPPSNYQPHVPPQLDDICLRALQIDPEQRFQTAGQMAQAIYDALREVGTHRELEITSQHMRRVFAKLYTERRQLLRSRALRPDEIIVDPVDELAAGTPAAKSSPKTEVSSPRRRWLWPALATIVLVGGAAVAVPLVLVPALRPPAVKSTQGVGDKDPVPAPALVTEAVSSAPITSAPVTEPVTAAPVTEPVTDVPGTAPVTEARSTPKSTPRSVPKRSAAVLYSEGAELFVRGQHAEAKARFKAAIEANPSHAQSHRGLGLVYQALGNKSSAISSFEKYLRLAPDASDAEAIRARVTKLKGG